jgi:HNH endonuclease
MPKGHERPTCTFDGCERPHEARGYCTLHYDRWKRHGDPGVTRRSTLLTWQERYEMCVVRGEGCWGWSGTTTTTRGYTVAKMPSPAGTLASRASWLLHRGPIPEGLSVLHHCDEPLCTNPEHLYLGTQSQNMKDMWARARRG